MRWRPRAWSPTAIPIPSRLTPPIPAASPSKDGSTRRRATGSPRAGTRIERLDDWSHWTGGVCAVRKDLETGEIEGAADPRRMSRALGW